MIFIQHRREPERVNVTYAFHIVQDAIPPEFVQVVTEVEL